MDKRLIGAITFGMSLALAACGGGGGGGGVTPPTGGSTPTPTPTQTQSATTTNATGTVVNDANGTALAGARVVLMPWGPCGATPSPTSITPEDDGCPTPLPSPQATTDANGNFTLTGAPNGHYLLVIGSDSTSSTGAVQATVHDNVTLTGGNQSLKAPTLPPIPTVTPATWETNGDYRLSTLDIAKEDPCFAGYNQKRTSSSLPATSVDEWLMENARAVNAYFANGSPGGIGYGWLATGNETVTSPSCNAATIAFAFNPPASTQSTDLRNIWFAGIAYSYQNGTQSSTSMEFPVDPRSYTDPNVPTWP